MGLFDWTDVQPSYLIYTDGGAVPNPGEGGWAYVIVDKLQNQTVYRDAGYEKLTTNNQMELQAAIEALKYKLPHNSMLYFYTDSEYLHKGASMWVNYWIASDWRKKNGRPVENVKLWKELHKLMQDRAVVWYWVKGHSGNRYNEQCDLLAREARQSKGKGKTWKYIKSLLSRL